MKLKDFTVAENFPNRIREAPKSAARREFPEWTKFKRQSFSNSTPFHMTLEQWVFALFQDLIRAYGKNRGGKDIVMPRILDWYEKGIMVEALGEIPLGNYFDVEKFFKLPSHHHRSCYILYLYWHSPHWDEIKNELVAVRVFEKEKFSKLYATLDNGNKQDKDGYLKNPDMLVGRIISCEKIENHGHGPEHGRLCSLLSIPARDLINSKGGYYQPIASVTFANEKKQVFGANGKVYDLLKDQPAVYACRGRVDKVARTEWSRATSHQFLVTDETLRAVAAGIEDYLLFEHHFRAMLKNKILAGDNVDTQKKIIDNTAFFSYYLADRVIFNKLPSAERVATALNYFCNHDDIRLGAEICLLWNNGRPAQERRTALLNDVLNRKVPKPKV